MPDPLRHTRRMLRRAVARYRHACFVNDVARCVGGLHRRRMNLLRRLARLKNRTVTLAVLGTLKRR